MTENTFQLVRWMQQTFVASVMKVEVLSDINHDQTTFTLQGPRRLSATIIIANYLVEGNLFALSDMIIDELRRQGLERRKSW